MIIIDETLIQLYALMKIGNTLNALTFVTGIITTVCVFFYGIIYNDYGSLPKKDREKFLKGSVRVGIVSFIIFIMTLTLSLLAPTEQELKAYAALRIGEEVTNSEAADKMLNAAIKFIEGNVEEINKNE